MKTAIALLSLICCSHLPEIPVSSMRVRSALAQADTTGHLLYQRFPCPEGYSRAPADSASFAFYLQHLPLKPAGSEVKLFNGNVKPAAGVYAAVVDMEITPRDLQQCADAVMRLRGEYLFSRKRYDEIAFRFTGDGKMHSYLSYARNDRSYKVFRKYMDHVFAYANTASLKQQLKPADYTRMQIGDVLIQQGNPFGHAVMIVDMCSNPAGDVLYMLAQSYMPAQETQILLNPAGKTVWYNASLTGSVQTPEWTFQTNDLRSW